jgi:tRNA1Val (adenine37-N6)-methyltransferase
MSRSDRDGWSADRPAPGLVVHQPRAGFRYGAEAFWLVGFALEGGRPRTALDLGTGSGILAWLLARQGVDVDGVELEPAWSEGWSRTAGDSVVPGRVGLHLGDVTTARFPAVDLVVSNPPFFPLGSGPMPDAGWRRAARFEVTADLCAFVTVACDHLAEGGRACLVVPQDREDALLDAVPAPFGPSRVVRVGRRRVLVEICRSPGPVDVSVLGEDGARARAWYAVAGGALAAAPEGA